MKTLNTLFIVAATAAAMSCIKEHDIPTATDTAELTQITFNGVADEAPQLDGDGRDNADNIATKTVYQNRSIFWEETDAISVFFAGNNTRQTFTIKELSEDKSTAVFEGLGVQSAEKFLATYPDRESNTCDGTSLKVSIPASQQGTLNSFESGSNVAVAYSENETFLFKNAGSLIGLRFATQAQASKIASLTIRAKSGNGYVGLTGDSSVTIGQEGEPVAGAGSVDYVTMTAPEGGFIGGTADTYFVAVYPFKCEGIEVTMTGTDGEVTVLENDTPATVARNTGLAISGLSTALKLPDEFEVVVDFSKGWPFKEPRVSDTKQMTSGSGDIYIMEYPFEINGKTHRTDLLFYMFGGATGGKHTPYAYASNQWRTSGENARILLPGIGGRQLESVTVEVNNAAPNYKRAQIVGTDWELKVEGPQVVKDHPSVISFPNGYFWTEPDKAYYLRFPIKNMQVTKLTLRYVKELKDANIPEDTDPTGHFSLMQMTNAGTVQMMSYIMKTDAGKVIVIDGGNAGEDAVKLRNILKEKYDNKVHMWWITHPHTDHLGALNEILDDKQELTIEYIMHSRFSATHLSRERTQGEVAKAFYEKLDAEKSTKVIGDVPAGACYNIDGVIIRVLGVTNEEITVNPYNNSSIILRFEDKDKSVLFLADAGEECGDKALKKYRHLLDCDYIQLAHHGQRGVREEFYKSIRFSACLWPTPKWLWDAADGNANDWRTWQTRQWMDELGIKEHHKMWEEIDWFLE